MTIPADFLSTLNRLTEGAQIKWQPIEQTNLYSAQGDNSSKEKVVKILQDNSIHFITISYDIVVASVCVATGIRLFCEIVIDNSTESDCNSYPSVSCRC